MGKAGSNNGRRRGRWIALAGLLLLPFLLMGLANSSPVRAWALQQAQQVLRDQLGLAAEFEVSLSFWPPAVVTENVVVPSNDGGEPFLAADRISMRPGWLALLSGDFVAAELVVEDAAVRVVFRDGALANLTYQLPEIVDDGKPAKVPFSEMRWLRGRVQVDVDGDRFEAGAIDFSIDARRADHPFVELSVADLIVSREAEGASHDDFFCALQIDAEIRLGEDMAPKGLVVTRLDALGAVHADLTTSRNAICGRLAPESRVELTASGLEIDFTDGSVPRIAGRVGAQAPLALLERLGDTPAFTGWARVDGELNLDGTTRLPRFNGRLIGEGIGIDGYMISRNVTADVVLENDAIKLPVSKMRFAGGNADISDVVIRPLDSPPTLTAGVVHNEGIQFSDMMRDLGVTPDTIVGWDLGTTIVTDVNATLYPFRLDSQVNGTSGRFAIFDSSVHDPNKKRLIGFDSSRLKTRMVITPEALQFRDIQGSFGKSKLGASLVSIPLSGGPFRLSVDRDSEINIADIGPVAGIPMEGLAKVRLFANAHYDDIVLSGSTSIDGFVFAGFDLGDIDSKRVEFKPLVLEISDSVGRKGESTYTASSVRVDFEKPGAVIFDADVDSEDLDVRDFLSIWGFHKDPRFAKLDGSSATHAKIHYEAGGPLDKCGDGYLRVKGELDLHRLDLFGERYDGGRAELDLELSDPRAGHRGMSLDLTGMNLRKGPGSFIGSFRVRPGAKVEARGVGTGIPLRHLDALGIVGYLVAGAASAELSLSGTLDAMAADARVHIGPVRSGAASLPPSELTVTLRPTENAAKARSVGRTRCGNAISAPFDAARWLREDASDGVFEVNGQLFGSQVKLNGVQITQQRNREVSGAITFAGLDLGMFSDLMPRLEDTSGELDAQLKVDSLPLERLDEARLTLALKRLAVRNRGVSFEVSGGAPMSLTGGKFDFDRLDLRVRTRNGAESRAALSGWVSDVFGAPRVGGLFVVEPTPLGDLLAGIPGVDDASGLVQARLRVDGPLASPAFTGEIELEGGELRAAALPTALSDMKLLVRVDGDELRIVTGRARVGGGQVVFGGAAKISEFDLRDVRLTLDATDVALTPTDGVRVVADASLSLDATSGERSGERALPTLVGDINIRDFVYTRPVRLAGALPTAGRTRVDGYDPARDRVRFDITLHADRPMKLANNLIDAELEMDPEGLVLGGTDQRYGLRGALRVRPGGRLRLRRSVFEVRDGRVRFEDMTRIAPKVDLTAVTQYRRSGDAGIESQGADVEGTTSLSAGGRWLVTLHASGDADDLRLSLTSEPALAQEDLFLLLTVGLTRAELEQARAATLGGSVALEAVSALSGADEAVTRVLPVIDDFRFGSAYSPSTGKTEPTVTIGKRLTETIRANVTSGLTGDSQEVRSNLEWRLSDSLSVEGSYDNVNDLAGSSLGNVGADVRWRLEFE